MVSVACPKIIVGKSTNPIIKFFSHCQNIVPPWQIKDSLLLETAIIRPLLRLLSFFSEVSSPVMPGNPPGFLILEAPLPQIRFHNVFPVQK
jgi:hypothetical protein